jgi:hypothetical protein
MNFANNGILGDVEAVPDLTGRKAFVPESDQCAYALWRPFFTHFLYYSRDTVDIPRYSQRDANRSSYCFCGALVINLNISRQHVP